MTGWAAGALLCPLGSGVLRADTAHSLRGAGRRWPVVADIPFLRADRQALADAALAALDSGDADTALVLLLADQDNWARTPPPDEAARRCVVREAEGLTFRAAMDLLAFGAVGTYFAHRWSDPTFLSGLALAEAHGVRGPVFELACGAGHFLREFARVGLAAAGGDIVFAKLWLARRFVAPEARLVCFDAAAPWPLVPGRFASVFCHDAFYFLPDKARVAASMQAVAPCVLIGHAHNALVDNFSSGEPLAPDTYGALFPGCTMYDDRELTAALLAARAPVPGGLAEAPAVSWAWGTGAGAGAAKAVAGGLAVPAEGAALRRNPLYRDGALAWPSPRYEAEYAALATYPARFAGPERAVMGAGTAEPARCRALLDLPASW